MITAYDKVYLEKAQVALGRMLDFAVNELKYDITDFFNLFITSEVSKAFENGDSSIILGRSGVELSYLVCDSAGFDISYIKPRYSYSRSEEYWVGWALAYYQWQRNVSFSKIIGVIPIKDILKLYSPYHEMDIRHFADRLDEIYSQHIKETNLKMYRKRANLSQVQLADYTGIPLKTIRKYEQRERDINKAQVESLISLSKVLSCDISDLIETID